jgi:hypothetical protein
MSPSDISAFLFEKWDLFALIFGTEIGKDGWHDRMEKLRGVRNLYAHSRESSVTSTLRSEAEEICHQICVALDKFTPAKPQKPIG